MKSYKYVYLLIFIVFAMLSLAFATVPLYKVFCSITGYGGTTRRVDEYSATIGKRVIKVFFNADISPELKWKFVPLQKSVFIRTGEHKLIFYRAQNLTNKKIVGMAVYNVTPNEAGKYFNKVACFCFEKQELKAKESAVMPVSFFIDPKIEEDKNLKDLQEVTLSYTFFKLD